MTNIDSGSAKIFKEKRIISVKSYGNPDWRECNSREVEISGSKERLIGRNIVP
ncbi:MAG: hypothetical protein M1498_03380 [Candidatus Thermoplasmatota archaeon]|nr:hypothetical protein [Candidatus Thermoplasmatota archaeon]MCL5889216.1 hypothetical protein [Candidatus Thermoplasmatota archaeon]